MIDLDGVVRFNASLAEDVEEPLLFDVDHDGAAEKLSESPIGILRSSLIFRLSYFFMGSQRNVVISN